MKLFDFDKLINTLTGYIETKLELLKMDIQEGLSVAITKLVLYSLIAILGLFVLLFLFLGLSQWLNQLLESVFWGYFLVAAFFGLGLFLVLIRKEQILSSISEKMKSEAQEEKTEDDA